MRGLAVATVAAWLLSVWQLWAAVFGGGLLRRFRRLAAAAFFAGLGAFCGALLFFLQAFHAFSGETRVAQVTVRRLTPEEFELTYTPNETGAVPRTVRLRGDQWVISGGIVKWHPWMTALGLSSYQRPMQLAGQFSNPVLQQARAPTLYLLAPERDWVLEGFVRLDPALPFVEAVYGSSAFVYLQPGVTQEVYVTPSGYLIRSKKNVSR